MNLMMVSLAWSHDQATIRAVQERIEQDGCIVFRGLIVVIQLVELVNLWEEAREKTI